MERTVPVEFVRAMVLTGEQTGVSMREVLDTAGIPKQLLSEARSRITSDQVASLIRELWVATDDELFGLGAVPVARGSISLLGLSLVHTVDLRAAIHRFVQFQRLTPGLPRVSVRYRESTVRVEMETSTLRDPGTMLTTFLLSSWHRIFAWLIGQRIPLMAVELPFAEPLEPENYQVVFDSPIYFGAPHASIEFSNAILDSPVVQTEQTWLEYANRAPFDILDRREYGTALADRVRSLLSRDLTVRMTGEEVGRILAMSPQTLRRRLTIEGTSVTDLRDEILRDHAVTSLVRGEETIEELSQRLGFSEPSAFRRAFRRWTGSPPRTYQHRHGSARDDDE